MNINTLDMYIAKYLVETLKKDPLVYLLVIDGWESYYFNPYKRELTKDQKDRIINMGISEQNAVGVAAGLAMAGKTVYLVMFAAFLTARAFEQIKLDVGYNNANVKLIGIHGGISGPRIAGYSHWAIEDLAMLNAVPNLTIYTCSSNKKELDLVLNKSYESYGPVYIRCENPGNAFTFYDYIPKEGLSSVIQTRNARALLLATGNMVQEAVNIAKQLNSFEENVNVYSVNTIKPFNRASLCKLLASNLPIITLEEHVEYGGLSSIVATEIATGHFDNRLLPICIKNKNYNVVLLDYQKTLNLMFDLDKLPNNILKFMQKSKKYNFKMFYKKIYLDNKQRYCKSFILCGIKLIEEKTYMQNHICINMIYLLGVKIYTKKVGV